MNPHKNILVKHVHDKKRTKLVGTVVAFKDDGIIKVGYSKNNFKAGDKFSRSLGINYAKDRASTIDKIQTKKIPKEVLSEFYQMIGRASAYYKDAVFIPEQQRYTEVILFTAVGGKGLENSLYVPDQFAKVGTVLNVNDPNVGNQDCIVVKINGESVLYPPEDRTLRINN